MNDPACPKNKAFKKCVVNSPAMAEMAARQNVKLEDLGTALFTYGMFTGRGTSPKEIASQARSLLAGSGKSKTADEEDNAWVDRLINMLVECFTNGKDLSAKCCGGVK